MQVSSRVQIYPRAVGNLTANQKKALELTAEALLTEVRTAQKMPFYTGTLQNDNTFVDNSQSVKGIVSIVSATPYARRLYFHPEYNFFKGKNSDAGGKWFEDWISGDKKDWCKKTYKKIYKQLTGV